MTLLEAISPTARMLLADDAETGGGTVISHVQQSGRRLKVHVLIDGRPACGGGCGARLAQWQQVLLEVNCERCRAILFMNNKDTKTQSKNENDETNS